MGIAFARFMRLIGRQLTSTITMFAESLFVGQNRIVPSVHEYDIFS